jgi:uncharacterized membrane protein
MRTGRLEAFSDGVLAIIITVMVLELREPDGASFHALWTTSGSGLLTYVLSFVYTGIYWANHHHMFQLTERVTGGILWANLVLLFFLSLFPFSTEWVAATDLARIPVFWYGLNLLAAGFAYWVLQAVIIHSQGKDSILKRAVGRDYKGRLSPVGYILGCVAALFASGTGWDRPAIWVAVFFFVAVAGLWVIPDRRIETVVVVQQLSGDDDDPGEPGR